MKNTLHKLPDPKFLNVHDDAGASVPPFSVIYVMLTYTNHSEEPTSAGQTQEDDSGTLLTVT